MTLIFKNKSVVVNMKEYLKEAMEELDIEYGRKVTMPAANHLFDVNEHQVKLGEDQKNLFHRITAKLLFVSKRGRPDIQVAISFLTTRVTQPDEDDWKKLLRLMRYIDTSIDLLFTLSIDSFNAIK